MEEDVCSQPILEWGHNVKVNYSFNTGSVKSVNFGDFIMFTAMLSITAAIGFYYARKECSELCIEDFLLAGRQMSPYPVGLSLLATFTSAITMLGVPAELYQHSTMFIWSGLGFFLVTVASAHIYLPLFYRLQVITTHEYLQLRFSRGVRTASSLFFITQMVIYVPLTIYAPSLALNTVTDFPLWGSVISVTLVCTIYTAFGGMRAVLWTDSFQVVTMLAGMIVVLIGAIIVVPDWQDAWEINKRTNRLSFDNFQLNPSVRDSMWALVIGFYFTWAAIYGTNQLQVQRVLSCSSLHNGQKSIWVSFVAMTILLYTCCLIGFYMAAFYATCDPLSANLVTSTDQLLPLFATDLLSDVFGLRGVVIASLFSGAIGTVSSAIHSASVSIFEDLIYNNIEFVINGEQATRMIEYITLVFGFVCLALVFAISGVKAVFPAAMIIHGMFATPVLGVISLGMFFPWVNTLGAYCGLFGSLAVTTTINLLSSSTTSKDEGDQVIKCTTGCSTSLHENSTHFQLTKIPLRDDGSVSGVTYLWYGPASFISCIAIGLFVSFITGPLDPKEIDPKLMVFPCEILFPFYHLPESIRKILRFGVLTNQDVAQLYSLSEIAKCSRDSSIKQKRDDAHSSPKSHSELSHETQL